MKTITKKLFAAVLVASLSIAFPASVHATETQEATSQPANQANFSVSSRNLFVGDTLRVRVWATSATTLSLTYNNIILEYDSCTASVTKDGNTISFSGTEATFTFKAKSAGQAGLIVSGEGVSRASANVMVSEVNQGDSEQEETTGEDSETPETTETSEDDQSDDASSEDGDSDGQSEVTTTIGSAKRYVSVMEPPELPDGALEEAVIDLGSDVTIEGYKLVGGGNDFYYVYGIDEEENLGWFMYDATEKTISRIDAELLFRTSSVKSDTEEEEEPGDDTLGSLKGLFSDKRVWIAIFVILIALIIAIIINLIAGRRDRDEDDDDEYDEEDNPKVSPVRRNGGETEEPELAPITIDDLPEASAGVWDDEDDKHESPIPDKPMNTTTLDLRMDDSLIGEKHVDIMDLNDL